MCPAQGRNHRAGEAGEAARARSEPSRVDGDRPWAGPRISAYGSGVVTGLGSRPFEKGPRGNGYVEFGAKHRLIGLCPISLLPDQNAHECQSLHEIILTMSDLASR